MSAVPRASQILLVGQRIRQLRKSRHLTQADLASRIGITQSDLSRMESGEYKVGLDTLFKILHVFELSMSRFFEEAPEGEKAEAVDAAAPASELDPPERDQLLAEFSELSHDSRREVREFIAFKRQQAEKSSELPEARRVERIKWPSRSAVTMVEDSAAGDADAVETSDVTDMSDTADVPAPTPFPQPRNEEDGEPS